MKTKVRQSEATMCSKWDFVAHLSRIFFISIHSSSHDLGPKPTLADLLPTHGQ
jgi:hypothetical protein